MHLLQSYIMLGVNSSQMSNALPAIVGVLTSGMERLAFDQGRVQVVRTVNVLLQILPPKAYEILAGFLSHSLDLIFSNEEVTSVGGPRVFVYFVCFASSYVCPIREFLFLVWSLLSYPALFAHSCILSWCVASGIHSTFVLRASLASLSFLICSLPLSSLFSLLPSFPSSISILHIHTHIHTHTS
jgi:hypothetical protein